MNTRQFPYTAVMVFNEMISSTDFNRTSRNIADSGIKIFFNQLSAVMGFLSDFVKEMFSSILGR